MILRDFLKQNGIEMSHYEQSDYGMVVAEVYTRLHGGLKPRKIKVDNMTVCDYPEDFLEKFGLPENVVNLPFEEEKRPAPVFKIPRPAIPPDAKRKQLSKK